MEIKKLSLQDIPLMEKATKNSKISFNIENIKNFIEQEQNAGFIVILQQEIIGFAYSYHLLRPNGKKMLFLYAIDISPAYQNQKLGTQLLQFILDYAKENSFSECFVISDKANIAACSLYEKLGGKNDFENEIVYVFDFND